MRSGTWGRGCFLFALALLALPARLVATTADSLCAASDDPCVVSTAVAVDNASIIDVGARQLRITSGGALDVGSGAMTLRAATLTVSAGGFVRAVGTAAVSGGAITVEAGDVNIAGTVDASGAPGGDLTITASGTLTASGAITARSLSISELGGTIQLTAASATLSGPLSVKGGPDATGGDFAVDTSGDLTMSGTLDATGGDGGTVDIQTGSTTNGANLVLSDTAVLKADATAAGGFGGSIDIAVEGDGTTTGKATVSGQLSAKGIAGTADLGGGSGGCIDLQATGDIRIDRTSAKLSGEGGAPDGDGGEVDLTSDTGSVLVQGTITASVAGDQSNGGDVTIDSFNDITISGSVLITAGVGGGGDIDATSAAGGVSIAKTAVIDVSATSSGEGGAICLTSSSGTAGSHSVVVEGHLLADGGASGGAGGGIELDGGDVRVTKDALLHASGGSGGGPGGTLTAKADPGLASMEGPLVAAGGGPNGAGGVIAIDAVGRVGITGMLDGHGFGAGGQVGIATDTGPVDVLSSVTVGSTSDAGGSIEISAQGDVRVAGALVSGGVVAPGGKIEIVGCTVTICGLDSPQCPAGGTGSLSSLGPSGLNRVTGRDAAAILGSMRANQADGSNVLLYDGDAERRPLVLGQVVPPATLLIDASVVPCPACGNGVTEPPETCDDRNRNDGDGCSSSCQIEAPIPGDANGDHVLSSDDVRSAIAEIFDGDGDSITMVSGGAFPGAPGVDANGDEHVTAADVTATIKLLVTAP